MFKLRELAELVDGKIKGNADLQVAGFCSLDNPSPNCISYLEKPKDAAKLSDIMLGALVTTEQLAQYFPDVLIVSNPKLAFVEIMERFLALTPAEQQPGFIHERAVVDPTAQIAATATIEANAVINAGSAIGEHTRIGAGAVIGGSVESGTP
jgi:UDP-3-O-[3-hydroxymyristoyl] glucosamine N-acyltransferase